MTNEVSLDFKKFEKQIQEIDGDFQWPSNDVAVTNCKRDIKTVQDKALEEDPGGSNGPLSYSKKYFSQDWKVVNFYIHSEADRSKEIDLLVDLQDQEYGIDTTENTEDKIDLVDLDLAVKTPKPEIPRPLYVLMNFPEPTYIPNFSWLPQSPPSLPKHTTIMIHCKALGFQAGLVEPMFCTLAIYDAQERRRVSEDFVFHLNTPDLMQHVKESGYYSPQTPTKALFPLPTSYRYNENLYLVFMAYKILSGDMENHLDYYTKAPKGNKKTKLVSEIHEDCKRLAEFKHHAAWGAVQIFDKDKTGKLTGSAEQNTLPVYRGGKSEQLLYSFLEEIQTRKAKSKPIGSFDMTVRLLSPTEREKLEGVLNPSLRPVGNSENKVEISNIIREVQTLPRDLPAVPHVSYVNNLHIYPGVLNVSRAFTKGKTLSIGVKLMNTDMLVDDNGLKLIYNPHKPGEMTNSVMTSSWYKSKKSKFTDEVKIQLPFVLPPRLHVLFTIYQINTKPLKKGKESLKAVVGYAFLPLVKDNRVPCKTEYELSIANKLPSNYLSTNEDEIDWQDKVTMTVNAQLVSSIYPLDEVLASFIIPPNPINSKEPPIDSLMKITQSSMAELIRFLPVVFNRLMVLMSHELTAETAFENLVNIIVSVLEQSYDDDELKQALDTYIQYIFDIDSCPGFPLALVKGWAYAMKNKKVQKNELACTHYLYGLLVKALTLKAHGLNLLEKESSRPQRFEEESPFILQLVEQMSALVMEYFLDEADADLARFLNINLSHFINILCTIMDRGFVFQLIEVVLNNYDSTNLPGSKGGEVICSAKLIFLRVISESPVYTILNLPTPLQFHTLQSMKQDFIHHHFITGCLLKIVESCLASRNLALITMSVNVLSIALWRHDHDARYQSTESRELIASLYFPFILSLLEHWGNIISIIEQDKHTLQGIMSIVAFILKSGPASLLESWWASETDRRLANFFQILTKLLDTFQYTGQAQPRQSSMSQRYLESPLLFSNLSQQQRTLQNNSESADPKNMTKKTILSKGKKKEQSNAMPMFTRSTVDMVIERFVEYFKKQTPKETSVKSEQMAILEKNFQMETSKCILEVCKAFVTKFREVLLKNIDLFSNAFTLLVSLFKYNQSTSFLSILFVNFYALLTQFNPVLWGLKNPVCGELIYQTLRHCNGTIKTSRNEAISFYIALIKNNLDQVGNFSRTRLQSTIAVTRILGESTEETKPCVMLLKGLKKATSHFKKSDSPELHTQFKYLEEQIRQLVDRNQKIREFRYDPEMMCSLYYEISCQLKESPDERIAWLENLSTYYREKGNLEECAQTKIITAALVQEYLTLMKRWDSKLPAAFHLVCPNVETALVLPDFDDLAPLESEICQSAQFNHEGFVNLLKEAIQILKQGGFYESSVAAYQMMLPIFQESADYKKQRQCYGDLIELTDILTNETQINQRIFSTYYRVGFYGKCLGDLDEKEFIYKELNTTMVADFTDRMLKQFQGKYGTDNVIKLGNQAVPSVLDGTKCYIQIGSVEPYFTPEDLIKDRNTEWKRAYNLRHFLMNQPFTKSGASQGSHEEQWIRRTIFSTDKSFPFLEKRIEITSKRSIELSPIENAIELIRNKTQSLIAELNSHSPRVKILQRDLQGTLLVQVNAGPKAIASSFLDESVRANFPQDKRFELTDAFEKLKRTLGSAVLLNRQMIGEGEVLQLELQKAFSEFKNQLEAYPVFAERRAYIQVKEEQEAKAAQTTLGERAQNRALNTNRGRPHAINNTRQASSMTLPIGVGTWETASASKKPKLGVPEEGDDTKRVKKTVKHNSSNSIRTVVDAAGAQTLKDRPSSSPRTFTKSITDNSTMEKVRVSAKEEKKKEKKERVSGSPPTPEASPTPAPPPTKDVSLEPVPEDGVAQPQQQQQPTEPMIEITESDTVSPRLRRTASLPSESPTASPSRVIPKVDVIVSSPPDMSGDKFAKARIGITAYMRNVHSTLTELNQTALKTEDMNTAITYVKLVKFMKEELSKAGEIITLSPYPMPLPTKTDNKLELLKFHWQANVEVVNHILKDIVKELGEVQQADQLVAILKLLKKAHDEAKACLSQPK